MKYELYSILSEYFTIIAIILITVTVFGGYLTYQNFKPDHTTATRTETLYTYRGEYTHEATIRENTPVWSKGAVLKNRPIYFRSISPKLEVEFRFELAGAQNASGELHLDTDLLIKSSNQEGTTFWRKTLDMRKSSFELSRKSGSLEFSIHIPKIENMIEDIENRLDFRGGSTSVYAITRVNINGSIGGKSVRKKENYKMPVNIEGSTYSVGEDLSTEDRVTTTYTERKQNPVPTEKKATSITLIIIPIILLAYFSLERRKMDEEKIEKLREEEEEKEYDEWISRGRLPDLDVKATVDIDSLEDLVDLAIDLDRRVIYDKEKSTHYVLHENILYVLKKK